MGFCLRPALGGALRIATLFWRVQGRICCAKACLSMILSLKLGHRSLLRAREHVLDALARTPALDESLAGPEHHRPGGGSILLIRVQILGCSPAYLLDFTCAQGRLSNRGKGVGAGCGSI